MNNENLLNIIWHIREKIDNNMLVVFVGSGVSKNTKGMSSWYDIIDKMACSIDYSRCEFCSHKKEGCYNTCNFKKEYSTDEFLKIPQYVYNKNPEMYNRILRECIVNSSDSPFSSAIFELNPSHIITTNYDRLLEESDHIFRRQYDVIINDKDLLCSNKSKYIVKMHGDLNQPESIVLKEQDYLEYSQKHVLVELFIKSLLTDHTFLFIGYSLNDYNIKLIISWLNYMRSENSVFENDHKVGYIVLDKEQNKNQVNYFEKNNIGIIEIENIPINLDIPKSITESIGKRLYSFISILANPALDVLLSSDQYYNRIILQLQQHSFVTFETLLKLLPISKYERIGEVLRIYDASEFGRVKEIINRENTISKELKRLFLNSGIESIELIEFTNITNKEKINCGRFDNSDLFSNDLFKLYFKNDYDSLLDELKGDKVNALERCFYETVINGYTMISFEITKENYESLNDDQKLSMLYNTACLDTIKALRFDATRIKRFINNITSQIEKEVYFSYIELCEGCYHDLLKENESYSKIISDNQSSVSNDYYRIRNIVIKYYCFFFFIFLFFRRFSDLKSIFKPYVSILLYYNSKTKVMHSSYELANNRIYSLTKLDVDIITKFFSTGELYSIIKEYSITNIIASKDVCDHMVECFCNLARTMYNKSIFGPDYLLIGIIANISILLRKVSLENNELSKIAEATVKLFSSNDFINRLFGKSTHYNNHYFQAFGELFDVVKTTYYHNFTKRIISSVDFFDLAMKAYGSNFRNIRRILEAFIDSSEAAQNEIKSIIESQDDFEERIITIRLLYRLIHNKALKSQCAKYLLDNYDRLSVDAVYDFVLNKFIKPTPKNIEVLFQDIIRLQKETDEKEYMGIIFEPNYLDLKLEQAYFLYLFGVVKDLSPLSELSKKHPHLDFLLNPDGFDYSKVDFSNYMWMNFAKYPKQLKLFITHKDKILPKLLARNKSGSISEDEKKLLIRFFVDKADLWKL